MPGRDALGRGLVLQLQRGDRQDRDAAPIDEERVLVGAVGRAAVLDDPQPARRDLLVDAVVEQDDAVGDVLLEALAGQRVHAALAGDHRGDAALLEPGEQAAQFGAQHRRVGQAGEERLDRVEDDPPRADGVAARDPRRMNSPSRSYSPVSSISDALDPDVLERQPLAPDQIGQVVAERARRSRRGPPRSPRSVTKTPGLADAPRRARGTRARTASCRSRARRRRASAGRGAGRRR